MKIETKIAIFGKELKQEQDYWIQKLSDLSVNSNLIPDYDRARVSSQEREHMEVVLPDDVCLKLTKLTNNSPLLVYTVLLTALQICLHKYTGNAAIVTGSPARIKDSDATPTINALAIVNEIAAHDSVQDVLKRVRETLLEAYARQTYPFERLLRDLKRDSSDQRFPLFDIALVLQGFHAPLPEVNNDITLIFTQTGGALSGAVEFKRGLFDRQTIQRFTTHFTQVLSEALEDTGRKIRDLQMLTEAERHQLCVAFNQTSFPFPSHSFIHHLFAQQAARFPHSPALSFDDGSQLSYQELDRRSNLLAHRLSSLSLPPDSIVSICLERSPEMLVSILATLKAGAAYLPLDPSYPQERLRFMLRDSNARVLVTDSHLLHLLPEYDAALLCLDTDWHDIASAPVNGDVPPQTPGLEPEHLAYIIYTSGSTGTPKAVMVTHRNLVHSTSARLRYYTEPVSAFLLLPSFAFDSSVAVIFWTLCAGDGARVVLTSEGSQRDVAYMAKVIEREGVTHVLGLPSFYRQLLEQAQEAELQSLRVVIVAGEACASEVVRRHAQEMGECALYNEYGPTEASVWSTVWKSESASEAEAGRVVPIGRAIGNMRTYIMDEWGELVAMGVAGEIYVGGEGVTRGYMGRAELTAERYVPDMYGTQAGARLYRTGDVGRYVRGGEIEYLGRVDEQVKVRGYRIELGEIEGILREHVEVAEAVVVAREEEGGEKRLVGYVVRSRGSEVGGGELRKYVRERAPEYMVPGVIVMMEELPVGANGKVDRRALPAPDAGRIELENSYVAPRTPTEEMAVGIWAEILRLERVGVHDNFFELGGHSLLATQLMSHVRQAFQVELPVRSLFDAPTVASLTQLIEQAMSDGEVAQAPPIERVSRDEPLMLSYAQQRLWFLDQLDPGSPFYNVPSSVRLIGHLNIAALEQTLSEITRRHEALRTSFTTVDGQAAQIIAEPMRWSLPVIDLSKGSESERKAEVQRLAAEEAQEPFDLTQPPLLRAKLLRLGEEDHVVLFTMHHIVSDAWSIGILVREVAALYAAFAEGQPSPLEELPIQYADFANWQRRWLQGEVLEAQLNYWKEQLANAPAMLELPTDYVRPAVQGFRGARESMLLSKELSTELKAFSQHEGVTLFMMLLAVFQALLSRYSGQQDILVGAPIANRNHAETEALIGFFVNTLVMRTDFSGTPNCHELLAAVREMTLAAYAHQDVPFERLVDELQPERSLSHTPLFQVMFALQNAPIDMLELPGLKLSPVTTESGTANFDLTLTMVDDAGRLAGSLEYSTELFDRATIIRMVTHFETLLEGMLREPERRLTELSLIGEVERRQLLEDWSVTKTPQLPEQCIHELFEKQVEQTPHAIAVSFGEEQLSYAELNKRANRLAHHLRGAGIGMESLIAICVERSLEMITGVFGVLKAGAAYVPLDPAYPQERMTFMLEDARCPVLLTQQSLVERLPRSVALKIICLDTDRELMAKESDANPAATALPDSLAYIIYTSGSTGQPKGVMISHRSLVNATLSSIEEYGITADDRVLQFTSISFDVSAEEIFPTLTTGATLVMRNDEMLSTPSAFIAMCRDEHLSLINIPTAYWHELTASLSTDEWAQASQLRLVVIGGDKAQAARLSLWAKSMRNGVRLINGYGPTETTIGVACWEHSGSTELEEKQREVPIGRPIRNAQLYVLDNDLQPTPTGVPGELYIGGICLSRGYLNRPDLTAQQFIPHPFSTSPGERLYISGDLVRYLPDSNLLFLSRSDSQVKIRGFRIELAEIEAALLRHPTLLQAVVIAWQGTTTSSSSDKRLAAYIVAALDTTAPSTTELRSFLGQSLPEYMLPHFFIFLDALPLTTSGKVDRKRLPSPDASHSASSTQPQVAPRTSTEQLLAGIWSDVLGLPSVGIHDNFFDLGGDSILSIQIVARAHQAGLHLTPKLLFQHQSIASLAPVVDDARSTSSASSAEQGAVSGTVPLTPIQHEFFAQSLKNPHHYNQSLMLGVRAETNAEWLARSVEALLTQHDALRMRFEEEEEAGGWRQYNPQRETQEVWWYRDISHLSEEEQRAEMLRVAEEAQRSLNLREGPVLRAVLFERGKGVEGRLLLVAHHLVVDGVSWRILLADIERGYEQLSAGAEEITLGVKSSSYRQWANYLQAYAESPRIKEQSEYWRRVMSREVPRLRVDYGRAGSAEVRAANVVSSVEVVREQMSREETESLLREVPGKYHTQINEVLLAGMGMSYEEWSGERRLMVEMEGHGREEEEVGRVVGEEIDVTRTVGWFTTIYPVIIDVGVGGEVRGGAGGERKVGEILKRVKEEVRAAGERSLGYGVLRRMVKEGEEAAEARGWARGEVSFNYLGQLDQVLKEEGLLRGAGEGSGATQGADERREYLIEVSGSVRDGILEMVWSYSGKVHRRERIEEWAKGYARALRRIIEHCRSEEAGGYTPSDFPEVELSQRELDELLEELSDYAE